jgi:hypothetical protein
MNIELVTKEDLERFRLRLLQDLQALISPRNSEQAVPTIEGFKTKDVRRILGCSVNKLVSLRIARKIRWKKIGGTVYYNCEDVRKLLEDGY